MPKVDLRVNVSREITEELADLGYPLEDIPRYLRQVIL